MFLVELNPSQLVYLSGVLDKVESVPGDKVLEHAAIRQQLNQPQQTDKVVAQIKEQLKEQVANEMREQARQTPGPGAAMQPMPPQ